MQTPPTPGRVVRFHQQLPNGQHRPLVAIITDYGPVGSPQDGMATLVVFPPEGHKFTISSPTSPPVEIVLPCYSVDKVSAGGPEADQPTPGCWTWPPRV